MKLFTHNVKKMPLTKTVTLIVRVNELFWALKCKINAKHTPRCHHRLFLSQSDKRQQIPPLDRVEYQVMLTHEVALEPVPVGYLGYCRFGVLVVELVWTFLFAMVYQLTLGFLASGKILSRLVASQNIFLRTPLTKNFQRLGKIQYFSHSLNLYPSTTLL